MAVGIQAFQLSQVTNKIISEPHPKFVVILVGADEVPFGIQKDFLCAKCEMYRKYFDERKDQHNVEHVLRLPEATKEVFGLVQQFLYTGKVITDPAKIPSYESLVSLWYYGDKLGVEGLCDSTLDAMIECRRITERIPATPLLIKVWRDTPEGASIRHLLLSWTAEYMRSSAARAEFAKSLPQEVLSELVVTMSHYEAAAAAEAQSTPRKNVHYLDEADEDDELLNNTRRNRRSTGTPTGSYRDSSLLNRLRGPPPKQQKRRTSAYLEGRVFSNAQKLEFCADLLARMLSGPGFWTRLVGPFREPVEPEEDGVPDYFDKVKRPMDLLTIKRKMDGREYKSDEDFLIDVRQIFENCFLYWKKGDAMYEAGERLQRTFEEKFTHMNKWITKMGDEDLE